jgi:starch synthase
MAVKKTTDDPKIGPKARTRTRTRIGTSTKSIKVLMVTAEAAPFAKVGGLGDVAGTLPIRLVEAGIETSVFMPFYKEVALRGYDPKPTGVKIAVRHAGADREFAVLSLDRGGANYFFLDEPDFFGREGIYGPPGGEYPDSAERFSFLCKGTILAAAAMGFMPDIVHCHDWHAALTPLYMKHGAVSSGYEDIPAVTTIHNLAYQGQFGSQVFPSLGLPAEIFTDGLLEYSGRLNFLKGGIKASDIVTTVSPTYAKEIRTADQGWGLDGILRDMGPRLRGILNGLDYEIWNPETDRAIVAPYSAEDPSGRQTNREVLHRQLQLYPDPQAPLFAFVGRLVEQKGVDILARVIGRMAKEGMQVVILGTGEFRFEESLLAAARPYPGRVSVTIGFNDTLARRIYASSNYFLMPSRFEPCGLGQMIAMHYGALPVANATGGLRDTVVDLDIDPVKGNGFLFEGVHDESLWGAIRRAAQFFRSNRILSVLSRVMSQDYSWRRSAQLYIDLYREVVAAKER